MVMARTRYDAEARRTGARVAAEGFADRVYADDGELVTRRLWTDALVRSSQGRRLAAAFQRL